MITTEPRVVAILVTHNGAAVLRRTLTSVAAQTHGSLDLVAVDNGSTDGTTALLIELLGPDRVIPSDRDLGFPAAIDLALDVVDARAAAEGRSTADDLVLVLHDDLELAPDVVAHLVAASSAARVIPLFVLDDAILTRPYAAPNRLVALLESLSDLRAALRELGSDLVVRRGRPAAVVAELLAQLAAAGGAGSDAVAVHCSADVSAFARAREAALARVAADAGATFAAHPGVMLVDPPLVRATGGGHFKVFTPYWRRW